jgi:hypothetical protein
LKNDLCSISADADLTADGKEIADGADRKSSKVADNDGKVVNAAGVQCSGDATKNVAEEAERISEAVFEERNLGGGERVDGSCTADSGAVRFDVDGLSVDVAAVARAVTENCRDSDRNKDSVDRDCFRNAADIVKIVLGVVQGFADLGKNISVKDVKRVVITDKPFPANCNTGSKGELGLGKPEEAICDDKSVGANFSRSNFSGFYGLAERPDLLEQFDSKPRQSSRLSVNDVSVGSDKLSIPATTAISVGRKTVVKDGILAGEILRCAKSPAKIRTGSASSSQVLGIGVDTGGNFIMVVNEQDEDRLRKVGLMPEETLWRFEVATGEGVNASRQYTLEACICGVWRLITVPILPCSTLLGGEFLLMNNRDVKYSTRTLEVGSNSMPFTLSPDDSMPEIEVRIRKPIEKFHGPPRPVAHDVESGLLSISLLTGNPTRMMLSRTFSMPCNQSCITFALWS